MTRLMRWDPFREMASIRRDMDRLFDEVYRSWDNEQPAGNTWGLALDVREDEDKFTVKASLPGVDPNNVDITVADNALTIRGETKSEEESNGAQYHLRERRYGTFARSITLPSNIDSDKAEAHFEDGILTLELPKSEEAKTKRISVKGAKSIEAKS